MKKFFLSAIALFPLLAAAQDFAACKITQKGARAELCFQVPAEANVRYYLLEGSRDSLSFDVLERLEAQGSGKRACAYHFGLYDPSYTFYRVRQVDVMAAGRYSAVVRREKLAPVQKAPVFPEILAPAITRRSQ